MDKSQLIKALSARGKKKRESSTRLLSIENAEWHMKSVAEAGLEPIRAFVPGGLLLGWLVDKFFTNEKFERDHREVNSLFRNRKMSAAAFFEAVGGVLSTSFTNEAGTQFLLWYETQYMEDYQKTLVTTEFGYEVTDSWSNYSKISDVLNHRLLIFENLNSTSGK